MGWFDDPNSMFSSVMGPISQALGRVLSGGDPEASGAIASSQAMQPVVGPYLNGLPRSPYDPARSFAQNALDPRGIENAMNMALGFSGGGLGIKAYHASPYDFNAFDLNKIGTGQGAQTFGHGIYAAESPAVSGPKGSYDMEFTAKNLGKPDLNQGEASALRMLRDNGTDMDVIGYLARNGYSFDDALKTLNSVKAAKAKIYEVNINAEPHQFLDWDKPLSGQNAVTKQFFADPTGGAIFKPHMTGAELYRSIGEEGTGAASDAMLRGGIPGIRYLDQGSRGAGQGTSNYVVFNPSIVDILKKYGLAGLGIGGGAAAFPGSLAPQQF